MGEGGRHEQSEDHNIRYIITGGCPECHHDIEVVVTHEIGAGVRKRSGTFSISSSLRLVSIVVNCPHCGVHRSFWGEGAKDEMMALFGK